MRTVQRFLSIFSLFSLFALMAGSALVASAQEDRQYDPQHDASVSDPPSRAARLQYMSGSVSIQPEGTGDWVAGQRNRPLTNSDNIWADKSSRAEISAGTGLIRIDSETSLTLTNVGENIVQLQLHQGAMNLHVRRLYDNETYEVDTQNQAFTVTKPGDYRFDVDPEADRTVITVWRGEGESTGDGAPVRIRANQQARFSNGTSMTNDIHDAPGLDAFDEWARSRDNRLDRSASARYVSPDVVGYEDLDEYGAWRDVPEYGHVWVPAVAPGWAPYYNGNWIWEEPWGWTWVEEEPWGYAPFHYGRWVYAGDYWGWAPGPVYVRPYYAPALVSWFGGGWGWGVGFGFGGGLGWCALGWDEPFIPWYGVSRGYFNNVNVTNIHVTNVTNITNIYNNNFINGHPKPIDVHNSAQMRYANLHAPGGFTAVSRHTLVNALPVAHNNLRVSPNQLGRVTPVRAVDVKPTQTTRLGPNAGRTAGAPPQRAFARPVVTHVAPPAGSRGSFHSASPVPGNGHDPAASARQGQVAGPAHGAERPGQTSNAQRPMPGSNRPMPSAANHGPAPANNVRTPDQRGTIASRTIPRPPSAGGTFQGRSNVSGNAGSSSHSNPIVGQHSAPQASMPTVRPSSPEMVAHNNVPRPPSASMGRSEISSPRSGGPSYSQHSGPSYSSRNVPPSVPRPSVPVREIAPSSGQPSARGAAGIPRPTSPTAAPHGYSSAAERGNYSGPASRPAPAYGGHNPNNYGGSYSRPMPGNGGGSYNRPAPSYDRGSMGGGSYARPMPSYGGSGHSMPSYGGGGGYGHSAAPSYGGGGFGGGGHAPSGGGGGGGHVSGGGGGGGQSGGSSHGGHH